MQHPQNTCKSTVYCTFLTLINPKNTFMKQNNVYKKSLLALAFSFFAVTGALAQFSLGAELAMPMGSPFSDAVGIGFGGSVAYDGAINDNLSWSGRVGYISFAGKSGNPYNTNIIPITAGIKYYFTESNAGFYGAGDLGMFLGSSSAPGSTSESKFGFAFGVGYRLTNIDIGLKYNIISYSGFDANNLGLRVAYVFGGGN